MAALPKIIHLIRAEARNRKQQTNREPDMSANLNERSPCVCRQKF